MWEKQYVYVLILEDMCWYVGKTANLENRIQQHQKGQGSMWTKKHHFVKLHHYEEVSNRSSSSEESRRTAELMFKHGVNRVRGGEFIKTEDFTLDDLQALTVTIGHILDKDFKEVKKTLRIQLLPPPSPPCSQQPAECGTCGLTFVNREKLQQHAHRCILLPSATNTSGKRGRSSTYSSSSKGEIISAPSKKKKCFNKAECSRCGRDTHQAESCYARTAVNGTYLDSEDDSDDSEEEEEEEDGRDTHQAESCYARTAVDGTYLDSEDDSDDSEEEEEEEEACFRCGRANHWADTCYARTHQDGRRL